MEKNIIKISEINEDDNLKIIDNENKESDRSSSDSEYESGSDTNETVEDVIKEGIINRENANTFNIKPYIGIAGLVTSLMLIFVILYILNNKKITNHIKKTLNISNFSKTYNQKRSDNKNDEDSKKNNSSDKYSEFDINNIKEEIIEEQIPNYKQQQHQQRQQQQNKNQKKNFSLRNNNRNFPRRNNNNSFKYKKSPKDIYNRKRS
tara:strand:- start:1294 stop:1911 length:618 start_codon:yes stop_codon:yes gene_type:complete